jgi:hypothetical protein
MTGKILAFKGKPRVPEKFQCWECSSCGSVKLKLFCDGVVYCEHCDLTLRNLKVVETDGDGKEI